MVSDTDRTVRVGSVELKSPIMTASGTAGYGDELAAYFDLVVDRGRRHQVDRRLRVARQPGAARPRHAARDDQRRRPARPGHRSTGSTTICRRSIGTARRWCAASGVARVDDYRRAADMLSRRAAPASWPSRSTCRAPTPKDQGTMFAHDPDLAAAVIAATAGCKRPRWAKLSANTDRLVDVAARRARAPARKRSR